MAEPELMKGIPAEKPPQVIHPLAGFWFRLGALVADVFLLWLVFQMTFPTMRPFYLSLGRGSVVAGLAVIFLYVFLAEGPVGKGRTVGKLILKIRTTDLHGEEMSFQSAAVRAALMLILALPLLANEVAGQMASRGNRTGYLFAGVLLNGAPTAYILANVFLTVLHPLKQTIPDLLAQTIVVREAGAHNLATFMEQVEGQVPSLQRRAAFVALAAFLVVGGLNLVGEYKRTMSSEGTQYFRFAKTFDAEYRRGSFQPNFAVAVLEGIKLRLLRDGVTTGSWTARLKDMAKTGDEATSDSHVVVFEFRTRQAARPADLGTTATMAELGSKTASWVAQQLKENVYPLDRETRARSTKIFQPRFVVLLFIEEVNVLLYRNEHVVYWQIDRLGLPKDFYAGESEATSTPATVVSPRPNQSRPTTGTKDQPTTGGK